jgi:hypothetical protein
MSHISISSPFLVSFTHADITVGNSTPVQVLSSAATGTRRVIVFLQNKSSIDSLQVILASTGSVGILVPPLGNITLDNYNGAIRAISTGASTTVHIATSSV